MAINMPGGTSSIMSRINELNSKSMPGLDNLKSNKAVQVGAGIITGGATGGIVAALPNSAGKSAYSIGSKLFAGNDIKPQADQNPAGATDLAQPQEYNPMAARMDAQMQDPHALVDSTLAALKDPSVPQEYRDAFAEPLLKLRHFGGYGNGGQV